MKQKEINCLVKLWQTERRQQAANKLIDHYEEDLEYYAHRYGPMGEHDDLMGAAYLGFTVALDKFQEGQGATFRTYMSYWVRAYVIQATHIDNAIVDEVEVDTLRSPDSPYDNAIFNRYVDIIEKTLLKSDDKTYAIVTCYMSGTATHLEISESLGVTRQAVTHRIKKFFESTGIKALKNK